MGGRGDNTPCPALGIRVRELIAGEVSRWRTSLHLQDMAYDREVPMGKGLSVCSMTQALGTPSLGVKCLKADRELEQFGVTRVSEERGQKNEILPISE